MESLSLVVLLLPAVFLLHEAEEILFLPAWLKRNHRRLAERYPRLKTLLSHLCAVSPPAFLFAVAEEFLIVGIAVGLVFFAGTYYPFLAVFLAFSLHVVVHIGQWIFLRHYIPSAGTSLFALPYCIYGFIVVTAVFSPIEIALCLFAGAVLMIVNLLLAHKAGIAFARFVKK